METLCGMHTKLVFVCKCVYLSLVLQHVVSLPSALLVAAAHLDVQPVALVQHPHQFPLPHAKRSGNEQKSDDVRFNSFWWTQKWLFDEQISSILWWTVFVKTRSQWAHEEGRAFYANSQLMQFKLRLMLTLTPSFLIVELTLFCETLNLTAEDIDSRWQNTCIKNSGEHRGTCLFILSKHIRLCKSTIRPNMTLTLHPLKTMAVPQTFSARIWHCSSLLDHCRGMSNAALMVNLSDTNTFKNTHTTK